MMKCPKCGYERQLRDNQYVPATECPACGIVYVKSGPMPDFGPQIPSGSLSRKPSPVDEESLKKARERVEKRLRKQLEARVYDEKHAQTLQRARLLTAQALEKRKAERNNGMNAADELKSDADNDRLPEQVSENDPVLDLVDIASQGHQTEAPPQSQPDQIAAESETAPATAEPQDTSPDSRESSEKKAPETAEVSNQVTAETQAEEKQMDEPTRTVSQQSETEPVHDKGAHGVQSTKVKPDSEAAAPLAPPPQRNDSYHATYLKAGGGLARLLSMVAWIILLAGAIGTVLSWTTLGNVQADLRSAPVGGAYLMPVGLLLGFAYLATGVLGFAFFWVSSLINRQLKDIRDLLLNLPLPQSRAELEDAPWVDGDHEVEE